MTTEIFYSKEVTYIFEYNGDLLRESHFTDNVINYRHRVNNDDIEGNYLMPLDIKGTLEEHQEINAILKGERIYRQNENGELKAELIYFLPDVNCYIKMLYDKEIDHFTEELVAHWGYQSSIPILK